MKSLALGMLAFCLVFSAGREARAQSSCEDRLKSQRLESSQMGELKVSAIQFPVQGDRTVDQFLAKIEAYIQQAKRAGSGLVVFPELDALDLLSTHSPLSNAEQLERIADQLTPTIFKRIASLSRDQGMAILAGSFPRRVGARIRNTAFLAFPDGREIRQDKLFMTPDEVEWGWEGGDELKVFEAPWGRTSILICYDSEFPVTSQLLARELPEVILVPSMTDSNAGFNRVRWTSQARAVEHHVYVVHTGTVGRTSHDDTYVAQASLLTPQTPEFPGVLLEGPRNQAALVTGALDLTKLRQSRATAGIYPAREQNRRSTPIKVVRE